MIYAPDGQARLAWEVVVSGSDSVGGPARMHVLVDAHQARLLGRWNDTHSADNKGTGKSLYYGTVPLHDTVNKAATKYTLQDNTRGGHYVVDMNAGADQESLFTATDNIWGDGTMADRQTDAAYGQNVTWDFYKNLLGRNGIADDGNCAHSRVHSDLDNAYWDDQCFCMMYGDGGAQFKPLVALDVTDHEMTHGVTSRTAGLIGIGRDKATRIWYRALSVYMVSTETLAMARVDTIKAAEGLYGGEPALNDGAFAG